MSHYEDEEIAIVGIACRFPEANDYESFWQNLRARNDNETVKLKTKKFYPSKSYACPFKTSTRAPIQH